MYFHCVRSVYSTHFTHDFSLSRLLLNIPSWLPGLVDIYLEHSHFPAVLHVALHMSEWEALWPTSISVSCQDLWVMESKPDRSKSVLLEPTPGPLWDIMDEHQCTLPPPGLAPFTSLLTHTLPPSPPSLTSISFLFLSLVGSSGSFIPT